MPKFRSSHGSERSTFGFVFKNLFIVLLLLAIVIVGSKNIMKLELEKESGNKENIYTGTLSTDPSDQFYTDPEYRVFCPQTDPSKDIIHHNYFSLSYNEEFEQANWVAYELTKGSIAVPNVKRSNWFMEDGIVASGSADYDDYSGSAYTRGHLAPAGDMAFNDLAMKESFVMSNISPQVKNFNGGVWNELEQSVRDWAYARGKLAVVTGPLFFDDDIQTIGKNKVAVPHAFFKALMDRDRAEGISFIIPHRVTDLPLLEFALSIDELEEELGYDLFINYCSNKETESRAESSVFLEKWPVENSRYLRRVNEWNKRN